MQSVDLELIGRKIKELRLERGIRAKDLAERLYCDPSQISRLESGETAGRLEKLVLVANVLDVDVLEIVRAGVKGRNG